MLLIVWHSRTGAAQAMAQAACDGASDEVETRLVRAEEALAQDMLAADGYIFACPENLATMSGAMKEFFDRCYYPLLGHIEGRPYVSLIAAGSDGGGAQRQLDRIATGWRLRRVAEPIVVNTAAQTPEAILAAKVLPPSEWERCRALGRALGAGLAMGVF